MSEVWTVRRAVLWTADYLARKGADAPRTDADLLLADALGVDRVRLLIDFDKPLKAEELAAYRARIARRAAGEPLAYVLGRKEFYSRDFFVDERVLVPRPETEGLVEIGLRGLEAFAPAPAEGSEAPAAESADDVAMAAGADEADAIGQPTDGAESDEPPVPRHRRAPAWDGSGARALDLCAGSGCIGITLALERPGLLVDLVELETGAAEVARRNVERHGVGERCRVLVGDLFAALEGDAGSYQLIVSNPPYVPSAEIEGLAPEVKREPRLALDGGADGLDVVRRIVSGARERLAPGGTLALELSLGQPTVVAAWLREAGFAEARVEPDFTRRDRYVVATR